MGALPLVVHWAFNNLDRYLAVETSQRCKDHLNVDHLFVVDRWGITVRGTTPDMMVPGISGCTYVAHLLMSNNHKRCYSATIYS